MGTIFFEILTINRAAHQVNEEFYGPGYTPFGIFRCVAHFNALFYNELSDW